ncbi:hypothetical protein HYALB_00004749 [Hymenoscyphus albidus]|uniref:PIN domain-like protein n=1 Tax=Hymenoscyphus albidus TaxID=595503 RepID=A0A9N9M072_9HELO|nr:hypothetical protein HYALB_00004749 [Hymenoscyphus albidus]
MGVTGLWPILHPCARPTPLPTLNRKRLAVDASIWIYQFLKAVRDKEGNALRNSHVVGFFRRICKLLFFGIKPVFVFDGGAPILKRQTILGRKRRREGRRDDAVRTAGKLLAVQMQRRGEEEMEKRKRDKQRENDGLRAIVDDEDAVRPGEEIIYAAEMGMDAQQREKNRKFKKTDAYHLPDLNNGIEGMGQPNDPRIMSAEELEEYAKQFHNGEDVNLYDFSKIDFNGDFFMSLPPVDRYNILNAARLRSRLRMGLSKEQLEEMFPDRMAFSKFQIERVRERNELTQRLMNLNGMNDSDKLFGVGTQRIAGERDREYVLVKNSGLEGGYALGVVSIDKTVGERNNPVDLEAIHQKIKENHDSESDEEFEDVPVEGLNRLPKPKIAQRQKLTYEEFQALEVARNRREKTGTRNQKATAGREPSMQPDTLFVEEAQPLKTHNDFDDEDELNAAIAMSLQKDCDVEDLSESEHLSRAIALSLQKNHGDDSEQNDEIPEFEDVPLPEYEQVAVPEPKPLVNSSGRMVAHIVNNRANAAVPKKKAMIVESDSDSDMDIQAALAKARRQKAPEVRPRQPAPVAKNMKNPFDGPLPFESLNLKSSIFRKQLKAAEPILEVQEDSNQIDDEAGGFMDENADNASNPLPPWLIGSGDIRSQVKEQQKRGHEIDAEDQQRAEEEQRLLREKMAPIQIDSSDEGSDVEIIDAPANTHTLGDLANKMRAEPPVSNVPNATNVSPATEPLPVEVAGIQEAGGEDESIDWSESDHGDMVRKPVGPAARTPSKSLSPEFEDVEMGQPANVDINLPDGLNNAVQPIDIEENLARRATDEAFEQAPIEHFSDSFDEFSDPDDEELLTALAQEAETHAAFASTLNSKTPVENQASFEAELKALRNQQKKDRRDADEVTQTMVAECQALLSLFGIPYITAPMEAEAQCAELVRLQLVDGVVTDDCDIFLFGGTRVYKNMFNSNKFVECYLQPDIEKELSLGRDQLIAIAQLLGSDYTEGLPGVGPVTALEILSEFPTPNTGLEEFREWWLSVQKPFAPPLKEESSTFRKKFRRAQGTKLFLPPTFPSPAVTEAYLKPDVDSTPETFQWGVPDLDRLRDFLMATIGWSQERTDEVLVPVIRDMNRREAEGTQSNITRFFEGAVGQGAVGARSEAAIARGEGGSKRMREAVGRLKKRKDGDPLGKTFSDQASEWARKKAREEERENEKAKSGKAIGKGKKAKGKGGWRRGATATPSPGDADELPAQSQSPTATSVGDDGGEADADDESGDGDHSPLDTSTDQGQPRKRKGKGKVVAKGPRMKKTKV